ncbi:hypothetical protein ACVWZM_009020 [Bradyrhizobium sp. USDA 4501]
MRFRNLEKYKTGGSGNNLTLEIPLPKTPDGRVYRYSPNENAHPRLFLLGDRVPEFILPEALTTRMTHPPGTPGTVCPYSGTLDDDQNFTHPDDVAAAKEIVAHAFHADAAAAIHGMFDDLARKNSGNKFVKIEAGPRPSPKPAPRFARSDLLRELVCDECGRDYGVYAISLFCPDCGAPNIHLHFAREAELVREQVELAGKLGPERQELAYRMMGNAHEDVLTAFEATLKTVYLHKATTREPAAADTKSVGNAFQSIDRGRKHFGEFDFDPFGSLTPEALAVLTLNIQKRHVIGHNLGVADAKFAEHAGEARLGETVPLVGDDILQFAAICQLVIDNIDAWLAGGEAPPMARDRAIGRLVAPRSKAKVSLKIGELGPLAVRIGLWVSEQSEKGFDCFVPEQDLIEAFPESSIDELAFAIAELESDGYFRTSSFISSRLPRMFTTADLFITFDPHTGKSYPEADVVALVDLALGKSGTATVGPEELHQATGWPLRRFNPPFAYLVSQIDDRRVLQGGTDDYPSRGFLMMDSDRVALHRFAARLRR